MNLFKKISVLICLISVSYAQPLSTWEKASDFEKSRKYFQRAEWFYRQRAFPFDTIPAAQLNQEFVKTIKLKKQAEIQFENAWKPLGPKGIKATFPQYWGVCSGRVRAIDIHPTDPDIVYIGAASGGLWKTEDGGENWQALNNDFGSLTFGAVAIDPVEPNTIYAGTGESTSGFSSHIFYGNGLYKSSDYGETWNKIAPEIGTYSHTSDILVNPHDNKYIYTSFSIGNFYLGYPGNGGVWRSSDNGATWERTLNVAMVFDLELHPTDPSVVYAAVGGGGSTAGFYKSTDYGATWENSSTGLISSSSINRMQISLCKSSPNIIYSLIFNGATSLAFKSTNGGDTWTQMQSDNPLGGYSGSLGWYDQGNYDLVITVNPDEPNYVLVGNVELHKSTDGQKFNVVRNNSRNDLWASPMHVDYHKIVFAPSNSDVIYVGSDGGVFKSTDGGSTWFNRNNGLATIQLYAVGSHPLDKDILVGGAQDNGNFKTVNGGETNWELETTGDGMSCFFDYENPNILYHTFIRGGVWKNTSANTSNNFFDVTPPFTQNDYIAWTTPVIMDRADHNTIYVGSNRLWRSTNAGSSWSAISSFFRAPLNTLDQSSNSPEVMICAAGGDYSTNPQVSISTDSGNNWEDVTDNIPGDTRYIPCVVNDPNSRSTIYVVKSGFGTGKIYRSKDLGETWENISGDLPDIPHSCLFVDPKFQGSFYVGNDFGVYHTTNDGYNWTRLEDGMPIVPVLDMDYVEYESERLLRAATYGRSVYEINLPNNEDPFLTMMVPSGGESIVEGTISKIRWVANKLGTLSIYFSDDNQQSWSLIASDIESTDTEYGWTIPSIYSNECWIKLVDNSGSVPDQISNTSFEIVPFIEPQLKLPLSGDMAVLHTPTAFEWEPVNGAVSYQIQILEDTLFSAIVYEQREITQTTFNVDSLQSLKKYFWRVRAVNETLTGPYSIMSEFVTSVASPILLYPEESALDLPTDLEIVWSKVEDAENYHLIISRSFFFREFFVNDSSLSDTTFTLSNLENDRTFYWKVRASNEHGYGDFSDKSSFKTTSVTSINDETIPKEFSVTNNYPNPFNPSTRFNVSVPVAGDVEIMIYNLLGQIVASIHSDYLQAGTYDFEFDASNFISGVYIYQVRYSDKIVAKKMLYIK